MRSRYSAYSLSFVDYILKTTHPNNPDYTDETALWKENILDFCDNTQFLGLNIGEFIDAETVAYVTFNAILDSGSLKEKSRFLKENGRWLYESGSFD